MTAHGRRLAEIPASPRWARALLDGADVVGSRVAAEVVAAAEMDVDGDLTVALRGLRRGTAPESRRWKAEADRLERLVPSSDGVGGLPGAVVVLAYPERVARRVGDAYLFASGTRAAAPPSLTGHEWLAVAEVSRTGGQAAAGTGAVIRSGAPIDEPTARRTAEHLLVDEVRGELVEGKLRARRVSALGAIELSSTPVPAKELGADAVRGVLAREGLGVIGWSASADLLRRRLALLHRRIGAPWPDVSDEALLARLDEWLGPELAEAARTGRLSGISLTAPLRRLIPWQEAHRLDDLAPERLTVPSAPTSGSTTHPTTTTQRWCARSSCRSASAWRSRRRSPMGGRASCSTCCRPRGGHWRSPMTWRPSGPAPTPRSAPRCVAGTRNTRGPRTPGQRSRPPVRSAAPAPERERPRTTKALS